MLQIKPEFCVQNSYYKKKTYLTMLSFKESNNFKHKIQIYEIQKEVTSERN